MDTDTLPPAMEASFDRIDALLAQILNRFQETIDALDHKFSWDLKPHLLSPTVLASCDSLLPSTDEAAFSDGPKFQTFPMAIVGSKNVVSVFQSTIPPQVHAFSSLVSEQVEDSLVRAVGLARTPQSAFGVSCSDYPMFHACNLVSASHVSGDDLVLTATSKAQFVETEKVVSDVVPKNGDPSVFCEVGLVGIQPFLQEPAPIHAMGLCSAAKTPLKSIPDMDLFSNAAKEDPPVSKICNLVSLSRKTKSCELVSGFIVSDDDAMTSETSMSLKEVEPIALQCGIVASESGELHFLKDLASIVGVLAPYVTQDFSGRHALHLFDVMHSSPGLCNGGNIVALALGYHMAIRDKGGGHRIFEVADEFAGFDHGAKLVGNTTMYLGEILHFQVMIMHHSSGLCNGGSAIDLELAYHMRIRDKGGGSIRQTQKWIFLMPTSYMHWVHF